ncbi:DUF2817 domain-containing protein [Caenimonas soli]|uniref:DUF2817 domain-containing protein n=1 Tax=Caenimonas soli TaxID=2735555 RepID=UPI001A9B61EF|nr:DUF2817 domain-containing protein [Caenimonas soli]
MNLDSAKQVAPLVFSGSYLGARHEYLVTPMSREDLCSVKGPSGYALFTPPNLACEEMAEHLFPTDNSQELRRAEAAIAAYRPLQCEWKLQEARKSGQYTKSGGMFLRGKHA